MKTMNLKKFVLNHTCYYFGDTIKPENFDLDNSLIDEKPRENILIYNISYKTLINPKSLRIKFNQIDGFIRIYDGTRYLILFDAGEYEAIYNKIKYLISLKNGITYIFSHYFTERKADSYDSLPMEKRLILHNIIMHIKLVLNKDENTIRHF